MNHHYLCREKYRLELHWDSIVYHNDKEATLEGAYFWGPALKEAAKIESPDFIDLDLTPQLLVVIDSYYIVRLTWKGVKYRADKVILEGAVLLNDRLKGLHKFERGDSILINTENHEESKHPYHLVYESQVIRVDKEPYNYG